MVDTVWGAVEEGSNFLTRAGVLGNSVGTRLNATLPTALTMRMAPA